MFVERGPGVLFRQDAFEARVVSLDRDHRVIDDLADLGLLGAVLEIGPTRAGWNPEDVESFVFVRVFGICARVVSLAGEQRGVVLLEAVGDVFKEDEAEDDVLVFGRVHVAAQLVGGEPELGFEAEVCSGVVLRGGAGAGHEMGKFLAGLEMKSRRIQRSGDEERGAGSEEREQGARK